MKKPTDTEFIGTKDNLIYYKWQTIDCVRTFPALMRQTDATKKAAKDFGKASSRSKILRSLLAPLIADPKNKDMQVRLKKALLKSLLPASEMAGIKPVDHPLLGFRFNQASDLNACLKFQWSVTEQADGKIKIEIPAINPVDCIEAPAGTGSVEFQFVAVSLSFEHNRCFSSKPGFASIPYSDILHPAASIILKTKIVAPCLVLIALALRFRNQRRYINTEKYMPAEIVAVFDKRLLKE